MRTVSQRRAAPLALIAIALVALATALTIGSAHGQLTPGVDWGTPHPRPGVRAGR